MFVQTADTPVEDPKTPTITPTSSQNSSFVFSPSHHRSFVAKSPILPYQSLFIFDMLPEACITYIFEFLTLADRFVIPSKDVFDFFFKPFLFSSPFKVLA